MLQVQTSRANRKSIWTAILAIVFVSTFTLFTNSHIAAAEPLQQSIDQNASAGLEISPALVELNGQKGKTYTIKVRVHNVTKGTLTYVATTNDFTAKDETGTPKIVLDTKMPETASVTGWVWPIAPFTLKPQEIKQIDVTVTIPNNAEPGGHYGLVSFAGKDPQLAGTGIRVNVSTALVLLIKVDGAVKEDLTVTTMTTEQNGKKQSFFEKGPVTILTRLQNKGNVHVKPSGNIEVRNMFGGLVATLPLNEKSSNVLPNSIRRFESTLNQEWMIGRYEANLTAGYGTTGQAILGTTSFWVIPYKIVLVILAVLVTIGFIISRLIKRHNRRVIERYKKSK